MSLSRRKFMRSGALTALSAGLLLKSGNLTFAQKARKVVDTGIGFQVPLTAQKDILFLASQATFEPYIGSIFQARGANGAKVNLTLLSVTPYKPNEKTRITTGKAPVTDSTSLMFKATGKLPSFSSIPSLYHPALGKLDLFLTLHEAENGRIFYEAVINHI
ncbi:MAG: hypothetical protein ABJB97_01175 [Acidobacteriota bacterium]